MNVGDLERRLYKREKYFYWGGILLLILSFFISILMGNSFSPLFILYFRLGTVGIWLSYCLSIYFYYSSLHTKVKATSPRKDGVVIMFNGRELGYNRVGA